MEAIFYVLWEEIWITSAGDERYSYVTRMILLYIPKWTRFLFSYFFFLDKIWRIWYVYIHYLSCWRNDDNLFVVGEIESYVNKWVWLILVHYRESSLIGCNCSSRRRNWMRHFITGKVQITTESGHLRQWFNKKSVLPYSYHNTIRETSKLL